MMSNQHRSPRWKAYVLSVFNGHKVVWRSEHDTLRAAEAAAENVEPSLPPHGMSHPGFDDYTIWHKGKPVREWSRSAR